MSHANQPTETTPPDVAWYFIQGDAPTGPLSEAELLAYAESGQVTPDTLVWQLDFDSWTEAAKVPLFAKSPVFRATVQRTPHQPSPPRPRSLDRATEKPHRSNPVHVPPEPIADDPHPLQELGDAVSDDELAEAVVDAQHVRELLKRTSYYSIETTIPPASYTTPPNAPTPFEAKFNELKRRYVYAGAGVLVVAATLLLVLRRHSNEQSSETTPHPARQESVTVLATTPATKPADNAAVSVPRSIENAAQLPVEGDPVIDAGALDPQLFRTKLERARLVFDEQCWSRYRVPGSRHTEESVDTSNDVDRSFWSSLRRRDD